MDKNLLVERLKTLADERGISLTKAFTESGVGKNFISNMKTSNPSMGKITMLANYFGVSVDYLLGKTDEKEKAPAGDTDEELNEYLEFLRTDPNYRMMFSLMRGATKEDVEKAVKVIKSLLGED